LSNLTSASQGSRINNRSSPNLDALDLSSDEVSILFNFSSSSLTVVNVCRETG
jgi:hypothetical protein